MPCIALCEVSFIETLLVDFYYILPPQLTSSSWSCQIRWFYFFRSLAFLFEHYYKTRCLFGMLFGLLGVGGIIHFHCYTPSSHHRELQSVAFVFIEGQYFIIYISQLYYQQHLRLCVLSRNEPTAAAFCLESNFPKRLLLPHPVHLEFNKQSVVKLYIDYHQENLPLILNKLNAEQWSSSVARLSYKYKTLKPSQWC